jgi:hypothetical protein
VNQVRATALTPDNKRVEIVLGAFTHEGPVPVLVDAAMVVFRQVYLTDEEGRVLRILKDNFGTLEVASDG